MKYILITAIISILAIPLTAQQYQYRSSESADIIQSIIDYPVIKKTKTAQEAPTQQSTPVQTQTQTRTPAEVKPTDTTTVVQPADQTRTTTPARPKKAAAKKATQAPPASGADKVLLETGITFFEGGNDAAALDKFKQLRDKFPVSPYLDQSALWSAKTLLHSGKTNEAQSELGRIAEDSGEYPAALFLSGQIYRDSGNSDKAIEQFVRLSSRFPGNELADDALIEAAKIHLARKNGSLALASAEQVVKLYPDRETIDDAYYMIGMILEKDSQLRDIEKARLVFRKFVQRAEVEKADAFSKSPLLGRVKREIDYIERSIMKSR